MIAVGVGVPGYKSRPGKILAGQLTIPSNIIPFPSSMSIRCPNFNDAITKTFSFDSLGVLRKIRNSGFVSSN
jgi:hypothetical protein